MRKPPVLPGGGVPRKSFCFKYRAYRANRAANKKRAMMACFRLYGNLPFCGRQGGGYKCQYVGTPARTGLLQSQRRPPAEPAALATALAYFLDKAGRHGRQYGPPHWALSYSSGDFVTELRHLLLYTDYNERGFLCCEEKRSSIRKSALHAAAVSGFVREMP